VLLAIAASSSSQGRCRRRSARRSSRSTSVIEVDTQAGLDHVDGHRTPAFVISPYSRRHAVNSTFYTQIDIVRTIEQILGLAPMNQMDLAATPMRGVFTNERDPTPYVARPNDIRSTS
jgi:phospholipase C